MRQLQVKKHNVIQLVLQTITEEELMDKEPGDDENLSPEEEIYFTREVTEAIHETLHEKKRRRAYQSRCIDINYSI